MLRRKFKKIAVSGAVIALLIFLNLLGWLNPFKNGIMKVSSPILSVFYRTGLQARNFYEDQTDRRDFKEIVKDLTKKTEDLSLENARLKMVDEENKELRKYLNFFSANNTRYVLANVIAGGEINLVNQALLLNKGSKDGLQLGLIVANSNGQVVGKIVSVSDNTSEMCLVNQTGCQFAAAILNENKTIGILQGDLGLSSKMDFIPQTEEIKTGAFIVTSGLEKNISRGHVLGQVAEVTKENNALWQSAKVESLANLHDLAIVSVVLP